MSLQLSSVADATLTGAGNFLVRRLDLDAMGGSVSPIVGFDRFWMRGPTFASHPHAGFSAVTYVFEDSTGALQNRDSLGHDIAVQPGELLWTQAGSGVIHDESPAVNGRTVHGVQVFVNLSSQHKHLPPRVFYATNEQIPIAAGPRGNRIRVLAGAVEGEKSSLELAEPFDFFDVCLSAPISYGVRADWNVLIYVLKGALALETEREQRFLEADQAVGVTGDSESGCLHLTPLGKAHCLLLSGVDPHEPVVAYGPFIMNRNEEVHAAFDRYRTGGMGRLAHARRN